MREREIFPVIVRLMPQALSCPSRSPRNGNVTTQAKGGFFWDYSGIGLLGIDGIRVLLWAISFLK